MLARAYELAERYRVSLEGAVTWAFEFEDQPYFESFRSLATDGIDKPVLNIFRMLGLMVGERVKVSSAAGVDVIMQSGVRENADVAALAAAGEWARHRSRNRRLKEGGSG